MTVKRGALAWEHSASQIYRQGGFSWEMATQRPLLAFSPRFGDKGA